MRKGDQLNIGIGQKGYDYDCGAGGTFVVCKKSDGTFAPLIVAGGAGGGSKTTSYVNCRDAQLEEFGNGPDGQNNINIGSSGISGHRSHYTAGAGYQSDPPGAGSNHPRCFGSGLIGGSRNIYSKC